MSNFTSVQLNEYHTQCALDVKSRGPGTYCVKTGIRSDGMISSLFVAAVDAGATLEVKYYETTTGASLGEKVEIEAHPLVDDTTALLFTHKVCIPKLHSNVTMEAVVTGGNVTFGILQSSSNVSLVDALLATLGALPVTFDVGDPVFDDSSVLSEATVEKKIFDATVTTGKTRKMVTVIGTACGVEGLFTLKQGSNILAAFTVTPSEQTKTFKFDPARPIASGSTVSMYFTANSDQDPVTVYGFLMSNEF